METTRLRPLTLDASAAAAPDRLYESFTDYADRLGLTLYPHQDEAIIELLGGSHVILTTPTGSGKSLVATAAIHTALSTDRVSFYTVPVKALVSEKFFELVGVFGADNIGMLTGDAAVNAGAPIIACTAEVLANIALREGTAADVGLVVMDEFHYYGELDRGWAWQVPLVELTSVQFLLMWATLGGLLHPYVRQPPLAERRDAGGGGGGGGEDLQVAGPVRTLANDLYVSVSTLRARRAESELVRRPTGRAWVPHGPRPAG